MPFPRTEAPRHISITDARKADREMLQKMDQILKREEFWHTVLDGALTAMTHDPSKNGEKAFDDAYQTTLEQFGVTTPNSMTREAEALANARRRAEIIHVLEKERNRAASAKEPVELPSIFNNKPAVQRRFTPANGGGSVLP